ncbi:MAG: pentapeptide repeat-containing protein [Gammaproteobacteria bacterium]|nr:pentapeptide repeat-containing protein [Gammaproteobacteria bacterium]
MAETGENVNILFYHEDFKLLSNDGKAYIRQSHVNRAKQGKDVWNVWADDVLAELEKIYPENASEEEKLHVKDHYLIDFSNTVFDENITFSRYYFHFSVSFDFCKFLKESNFIGAKFSNQASFQNVNFYGDALFEETEFYADALFTDIEFHGEVYFVNSKFHGSEAVYFSKIKIKKGINFSGSILYSRFFFRKINCEGNAYFYGAHFHNYVEFESSLFLCSLNFSQAIFENVTAFERNDFTLDLDFTHANFKKSVVFDGCDFSSFPCDFRMTCFNQTPLIDNLNSNLYDFISTDKSTLSDYKLYESCEIKFRLLKQLAEKNNNHQKSLEFYACELYCQRRATGGLSNPKNWASYLYGLLSGYGLSLLRPVIMWLVFMMFGFISQALVDDRLSAYSYNVGVERAAFYISPSIPPFIATPLYQKEVRHRLYPNKDKKYQGQLPMTNRFIRFLQTLFTFVSLFLFGLALRNRFKIG